MLEPRRQIGFAHVAAGQCQHADRGVRPGRLESIPAELDEQYCDGEASALVPVHEGVVLHESMAHDDGGTLCYTASMRPGRTKTTSFSLDDATLAQLRALASRRHRGNVSALLAEIAGREAKFAAAEAYFEKYGVAPLSDADLERIEAEWRGTVPKKSRRRVA